MSVPEGASAMVELDEGDGFHYLVVRGFGENQLVAVTVGFDARTGYRCQVRPVSLGRRCRRRWIRR